MKSKIFLILIACFLLCITEVSKAVIHTGGHMTSNANIVDEIVYVDSTLYNDGYELYFENCEVYFAPNTQLILNGGYFVTDGNNVMRGQSGARWLGIRSVNTYISIYGTRILDVKKNNSANLEYALWIDNSSVFSFQYSSITPISSIDSSTHGIAVIYHSGFSPPSLQIHHDSILVNRNGGYAINIDSYSSLSGDFDLTYNYFKHIYDGGAGVILVGLEDAVVYANIFLNWGWSVYAYSASVGLGGNYISSVYSVEQLKAESDAVFDLSSNAGGFNSVITDEGECIHVYGSYFDIHNGENYFAKLDTTVAYFFAGYFPTNSYSTNQNARYNCFFNNTWVQITDTNNLKGLFNVKLPNQTQVNFSLTPFGSCSTDNYSISGITKNYYLTESDKLYSEMHTEFKKKNYQLVSERCKDILNLGANDMHSVNAVRKLFQVTCLNAISETDRLSAISKLKQLFESYISDKALNKEVAEEMNYYILKCKVACGEYNSALSGFKKMMESTEANNKQMLAKWEYEGLKSHMSNTGKESFSYVMNYEEIAGMIQNDIREKLGYNEKGVVMNKDNSVPASEYSLNQNYPNPFNPVTNIRYSLPKEGFVTIKVYDVVGRMIKELVNEFKQVGSYSVVFDGSQLSSGIYYYKIESANFVETKRMVLVK